MMEIGVILVVRVFRMKIVMRKIQRVTENDLLLEATPHMVKRNNFQYKGG